MPPIARIEPLTTARAVRGPFDYLLPPALADVPVGTLLAVPFGRREVLGVVVERAETSELAPERLAQPRARVEPAIPADLVALARWLADEYCSTPARALGLVLAPGAGQATRPRVQARRALVAELTPAGRAALDGTPARLTERQRSARPPCHARGRGAGRRRSAAHRRTASGAGADPRGPGRAPSRAVPAPWRDRLGQDRGLPAGGRGDARGRPRGARAGAGDRARAPDGGALPGPLRRHRRGAALAARRRRALRRVDRA